MSQHPTADQHARDILDSLLRQERERLAPIMAQLEQERQTTAATLAALWIEYEATITPLLSRLQSGG